MSALRSLGLRLLPEQPVVLAFVPEWQDPDVTTAEQIRAALRGLGAALVVIGPQRVLGFRPDDAPQSVALDSKRTRGRVRRLFLTYAVSQTAVLAGIASILILDQQERVHRRLNVEAPSNNDFPRNIAEVLAYAGQAAALPQTRSYLTMSRRELVASSLATAFALFAMDGCKPRQKKTTRVQAPVPALSAATVQTVNVTLLVNGTPHPLNLEPRVSLLDALRERLSLTGTKKGCDHGQCGACTVLLDGQRVNACLLLAVMVDNVPVTTIEGLGTPERLHAMQQAFVDEDALQCGYCTPGQIMSAVGLLRENRAQTTADIREQMSGNLCRCGAYTNIVSAIQLARKAGAAT